MTVRLLVIQHEATSPTGLLAEAAGEAGVDLEVVEVHRGGAVPERLGDAAGLVVLGGTMGVADVDAYPHLEATMALIRGAAQERAPALGICLGGQLAAHALGGRAYKGPKGKEHGWIPLEVTPAGRADPVLGALDEGTKVFSSHDDVFDPPPGSALLARGDFYPNQAFRLGSVVGVQFHPEVDPTLVARWLGGSPRRLPGTEREVLEDAKRYAPKVRRVLDAFCRLAVEGEGGPGGGPARAAGQPDPS